MYTLHEYGHFPVVHKVLHLERPDTNIMIFLNKKKQPGRDIYMVNNYYIQRAVLLSK